MSDKKQKNLSPKDLQNKINDGSFFSFLMSETEITSTNATSSDGHPKTKLQFKLPWWFNEYLTKDTQALLKKKIVKATSKVC